MKTLQRNITKFATLGILLAFPAALSMAQSAVGGDAFHLIENLNKEKRRIASVQAWGYILETRGSATSKSVTQVRPPTREDAFYSAFKGDKNRMSTFPVSHDSIDKKALFGLSYFRGSAAHNDFGSNEGTVSLSHTQLGESAQVSGRSKLGRSVDYLGFKVPYELKWPSELLESGRYRLIAQDRDERFGSLYKITGIEQTTQNQTTKNQLTFWIAPGCGYRIIKVERKLPDAVVKHEIAYRDAANGEWMPTDSTETAYDSTGALTRTVKWHIMKLSLNNVQDKDVSVEMPVGTAVHDLDANNSYRSRPANMRIYVDRHGKDTRPNYLIGWIFIASVSTLLVLTVGALVNWKRKHWAKRA